MSEYQSGTLRRRPAEESVDLYPGLVVHDDRVTGSITVGRTRLPLWAFMDFALDVGFKDAVEDYYQPEYYELFGKDAACGFPHDLMELRGEFGRLLLVLADAERCERHGRRAWFQTKRHKKRVRQQLERCIAVLEAQEDG